MNLLVTGAWSDAQAHIPELKRMGHEMSFLQQEQDALPCACEWVEGVICNGLFLHHPIERFVNLRYIQLTSAGYDRVPMDYIEAHGIEIHNARSVYSIPMAEFVISGVLQLYKRAEAFRRNQREHRWVKQRDLLELSGKTVLIVGCGSVGTECAKRFAAFGCQVTGINTDGRANEACSRTVSMASLDEELPRADVVVLTLPLTEQTRHLLDAKRMRRMKDGAALVNIARGAIMDEAALIQELPRLGGAVLDVFQEEPLSEDSPLWDAENVIVTPHNSFVGDGRSLRLGREIFRNLSKRNKCEE